MPRPESCEVGEAVQIHPSPPLDRTSSGEFRGIRLEASAGPAVRLNIPYDIRESLVLDSCTQEVLGLVREPKPSPFLLCRLAKSLCQGLAVEGFAAVEEGGHQS